MFTIGKMKRVEMPEVSKYQRLYRGSFSKIEFTKFDGTLVAKEWLYCREYFQDESAGITKMLFCHTAHRCKNIAAFLNIVEDKLKISKSIVGPTQRYNISWLNISRFWTSTSMKRSLFTILLRCGVNYKPKEDNFDSALFSNVYTKNTEYAVRRFLDGHTKYTGKRKGWYNQFYWNGCKRTNHVLPAKEEIDNLLIMPVKKQNEMINT